jgi:hypothetical protein
MTATITRDDLRRVAPSVFAAAPWEGMSPRYRHIPTFEVLDMLEDQGFHVTKAMQSRTRIPGKADFTRHMLRLRHVDHLTAQVGEELPEIVLVNSHDRSSAYKIFSGVFRLVCSNGAVVQSSDFGSFSIRHSGSRDLYQQVREATGRIMEGVPGIMDRITAWKEIILPRPDQLAFAREAADLKPNDSIPSSWLLTARRQEDMTRPDASRDLWRTFNVIQESLLRGGLSGRNERGRRIRTRPVKAVDADLRINRRLWQLAENYANN